MVIAFDCKGTLLGPKGKIIAEAFRQLQKEGHKCVIWSNLFSYTTDALNHHKLEAECDMKKSRFDLEEWGRPEFDFAIEDDRSQTWLGTKNFIWVDEIDTVENLLIKIRGVK